QFFAGTKGQFDAAVTPKVIQAMTKQQPVFAAIGRVGKSAVGWRSFTAAPCEGSLIAHARLRPHCELRLHRMVVRTVRIRSQADRAELRTRRNEVLRETVVTKD